MPIRNKALLFMLVLAAGVLALGACSALPTAAPAGEEASPTAASTDPEQDPAPAETEPEPTEAAFTFPPTPTPALEVEIDPGEDGESGGVVQVIDPADAEVIQQLSLDGVYAGHYHPAEYHAQHLFVIREAGLNEEEPVRELWRYGPDGAGRKLFTSSRIDFRVDPAGKKIAVEYAAEEAAEPDQNRIVFLSWEGEILQDLPLSTPGVDHHTYPRVWSRDGRYFWGVILAAGPHPEAYYRIDTQNWSSTVYQLIPGISREYVLNPDTGTLAFSDYPAFFEPTSRDRFIIRQSEITLSVYDLERAEQTDLITAPSHAFRPRWISDDVLAYDDPDSPGRILHSLSTGNTTLLPGEEDSPLVEPQAVPDGFESLLDDLASSGIDPILPSEFPVEPGQPPVHPREEILETGLYRVALEVGEDCGGSPDCAYGTLAARDVTGGGPDDSLIPIFGTGPILPLGLEFPPTGGYISGYYQERDCGPDCTEAEVSFLLDGKEYLFSLRNSSQGEAAALAQAALDNSLSAE